MGRRALLWGMAGVMFSSTSPLFAATPKPAVIPRRKPRIVVLDPGHGGIDPGAIGVSGVYEKDITLPVVREIAHRLENSGRYRVHLTRGHDEFVPLQDRVARARAVRGELFLSIHADALPEATLRGASVFTLSERASDKEAAALAARENKVDLIAGIDLTRNPPEVSNVLLDLARRETNNQSIRLAHDLMGELTRHARVLHHGLRSAGFAVLKAPDIPSALVEIGCLSNHTEDKLLRKTSYRTALAKSLAQSIDDYFAANGVGS